VNFVADESNRDVIGDVASYDSLGVFRRLCHAAAAAGPQAGRLRDRTRETLWGAARRGLWGAVRENLSQQVVRGRALQL
jgi:hypothetical protein